MSRSNNPQPQFAARPLPGQVAADQDPQAWNGAPPRAPHQGQQAAPHPGYAQPYAYQPEVPPAGPYAQNDQRYAQSTPPDPFAGTPYAAQPAPQARQAPAYAPPQHDPYAQAQAAQPQTYGAAPAHGGQPQWPAGAQAQDQNGYDLNGYAVGGAAPAFGTGYEMGRQPQQHRGGGQWAGPDPYGAEPSFEPALYAAPQQHGGTVEQTYAEEDAAYEMEAPQGRSRKFAMVLLGAVIVGGGLTYAYSALLGPSADGAPPVVKGAEGPFKVKPSEPGGKQFAHTDSKIMGRLGEGGQAAPSSDVDASGARKVPVLTVGRDGSIQAPAAPEESGAPRSAVPVPGMTVIGGLGGPPPPRSETADSRPASEQKPEPAAARMTTTAAEPQQPMVVSPPAAPKKPEAKLASAEAPAAPSVPQSSSDAADASAAAPSETPKKAAPAPKKTAAVAAPATAATVSPAAQPAPTGAGWVAVLASVPASDKSRMEALKQFADMQQKYAALLQNKTPDIQEANLGEKGTYHRLMVGPPGSREMASELCTQLKAQGYPSCWVTAY